MDLNFQILLLGSNGFKQNRMKPQADIRIHTYHSINLLIGIAFTAIFIYVLIFRGDNHPIPALLTELTGEIPPSKGLSASFSEIIRGNLSAANNYNPHGIRVFAFFAIQLLLRLFFSVILLIRGKSITSIALADSIISVTLFTYCFWPLILYTLQQMSLLFQNL